MTPQRIFLVALSLTAAAGVFVPQARAQSPNTVIHLNYSGGTCNFNTSGISISGSNASIIDAIGSFDFTQPSTCPTGGSGSGTGVAEVDLSVVPATIDKGDAATITWSAVADVCRFDGSVLPGAVANWQTSGYACIGASACQTQHVSSPVFNTAGAYSLKLSCQSGAHDTQPQTSDIAVAAVQVNGIAPPQDNCVAPAGLTRDTTGTIATSSGSNAEIVDVTEWGNVYGHRMDHPSTVVGWPGYFNRDVKVSIPKNHYWALKFTVGNSFPYYGSWGSSGVGPWGTWNSNASNSTYGVNWTLSISQECGDFSQPAPSDPKSKCFAPYTISSSGILGWVVAPTNQFPVPGLCTLRRGQTYYLNILPAKLGDPLNATGSGCNASYCKANFSHSGNFDGSQGM